MTYRILATAVVVLTVSGWGWADIIYTSDGKQFHAFVLQQTEAGYTFLLLDGTKKSYTKEQVKNVDASDKTAQTFFAVASTLDLQEKGGSGYLWLGSWIENTDKEAARHLYSLALQDEETASFAAYQISRLAGQMDPQELAGYLRLAVYGCPLATDQDAKRLQVALSQAASTRESLNKQEITIFYNIVKDISRNRAKRSTKLWADFSQSARSQTKDYLEKLCKAITGYDFAAINQEMLFLAGTSDQKLWQCPTCKGAGKLDCAKCRGEGFLLCEKCKGNGFLTKTTTTATGVNRSQARCGTCNGQGFLLCAVCKSYTQYIHEIRISLPSGVRNVKGSGFRTCPDCKGSGRKAGAPNITGTIAFVSLNSAEVRSAFGNLETQVWRLISSEDSWGAATVRMPTPTDFARDLKTLTYRFSTNIGRWLTPNGIDELIAKGTYTVPTVDSALVDKYLTQVASQAVSPLVKVSQVISGRDRDFGNLRDLVSYYEILTASGESASYDFRKAYQATFKKQAGDQTTDLLRPNQDTLFLLRKDATEKFSTTYQVRVEDNISDAISTLTEGALEATLYGRITSAARATSSSAEAVTVIHTIVMSPLAATVKRADGKIIEWVKTDTRGRTSGSATTRGTEEEE